MSKPYSFKCLFCGKEFGSDVVGLAQHIGKTHDQNRKDNCSKPQETSKDPSYAKTYKSD